MRSTYKIRDFKGKAFCLIATLALLTGLSACKKLVDVPAPISSINSENAFASDPTAIAAVSNLYFGLVVFGGDELPNTAFRLGLYSDEVTLVGSADKPTFLTYTNSVTRDFTPDFWSPCYVNLYVINAAIEGLNKSTTLTPAVKQQLLGEAKFDRAFRLFYLVNLYGDVPMPLTTDYKVNASLTRAPVKTVYQQIIADLKDAEGQLSDSFLDGTLLKPTSERVRPTKWAAAALLARAYLYSGDYQGAYDESSKVINNTGMFSLVPLDNAFLTNNNEAIWQLQIASNSGFDTQYALNFIIPPTGVNQYHPYMASPFLLNAFESGDQRKTHWIGSVNVTGTTYYFPYKYKNNTPGSPANITEYDTPLRLAEQYLIRAEAEANLSQPNAAVSDLNQIRARAGLAGYAGPTDAASLNTAILHERQVELFTEWGHRWFDLRRSGTADAVMGVVTPKKGGTWSHYKQLFPIPLAQMKLAPALVQNPGY